MKKELINKYRDLGIHIEKTKSRQEIFTNVSAPESSLIGLSAESVFFRYWQEHSLKEYWGKKRPGIGYRVFFFAFQQEF